MAHGKYQVYDFFTIGNDRVILSGKLIEGEIHNGNQLQVEINGNFILLKVVGIVFPKGKSDFDILIKRDINFNMVSQRIGKEKELTANVLTNDEN